MGPAVPSLLIPEEKIQARVTDLARAISADCAAGGDVVLVGVLRGCFIFLADLARRLTVPSLIDFIAVSAYRAGTSSPGAVQLVADVRIDLRGRHVVVVDDIVDTGHSLRYVLGMVRARGPASLKACVLLRKPDRLEADVHVDYVGFDIPDVWVVGYGLDYADRYRPLPYIGSITIGDS